MNTETTETKPLPALDSEEIRILGALMEKSKATPEYYPMTLNGLTAASNQKTSRHRVVNYDENTVAHTLDRLKRKGLAATVTGDLSRVVKYRHTIALQYELTPEEPAPLCLLFLRGPLTPGEINSNSGRLHEYEGLAEVQNVLNKLASAATTYIKQLPRQAGSKEARYIHLFGNENIPEQYATESVACVTSAASHNQLEERIHVIEQELAALKEAFDKLQKEWNG